MSETQAATIIRLVSIGLIVTGLIFASGAYQPIEGASRLMHDLIDYPVDGSIDSFTREARWFGAIGGGVVVGLAVLFLLVIAPLIEAGRREIHRGVIVSLLAWYVVDSAGSIAAGVPANAVLNTFLFVSFVGPILAIRPRAAAV